jgi:hypothetical protein
MTAASLLFPWPLSAAFGGAPLRRSPRPPQPDLNPGRASSRAVADCGRLPFCYTAGRSPSCGRNPHGGSDAAGSPRAAAPPIAMPASASSRRRDWHSGASPSSERISERGKGTPAIPPRVSDLARAVYPRHTLKQLARLLDVPLGTAREWLYGACPASRTQDVARALLPELLRRREEFERTAIRLQRLARGGD